MSSPGDALAQIQELEKKNRALEVKQVISPDQPCALCGTPYSKHANYLGCYFFRVDIKKEVA